MLGLKDFIIICGHYGCGKTNLSIQMAIDIVKEGKQVTLVDLDLVNPYFRTSDYQELLKAADVRLIYPTFGATNLDIPALPPEIYSVFHTDTTVILDVGGDDVGATVLGRFHENLKNIDYDMLYVVNKYRSLTSKPEEAAGLLREIERVSRAKATGIVNNSHLKWETQTETILDTVDYAKTTAERLDLPLLFTTVPENLSDRFAEQADLEKTGIIYPIDVHVRTLWEQGLSIR